MTVDLSPRIVVIGVGGAGGNAVNNMIEANLQGVEFVVANTDAQAMTRSNAGTKIQLGVTRTSGHGAGANPDVGAEAAKESSEEIEKLLDGAHMCFIAAGMGGGTGTGAAPIIARIAKQKGVLTVGVVTKPFSFEGSRRMTVAERGIDELRPEVDTLIVIPNQNLFRIASKETTFAEAFHLADRVLYSGVRGITDLMVMPGLINLDFADVNTIMAGMGTAMMGTGEARGENRALEAARAAIANPLLDDVSMKGAKGVIINITGGYDMTLFEVDEAANEIRREVETDANIILGSTFDDTLDGKLRVSVVAAGVTRLDIQNENETELFDEKSGRFKSAAATSVSEAVEELAADDDTSAATTDPEPVRVEAEVPTGPIIRTRTVEPEVEAESAEPVSETVAEFVEEIADAPREQGAPVAQAADEDVIDATAVEVDVADAEQAASGRSFKKLFGWGSKPSEEAVASVEPRDGSGDNFDDELEIPAFLRRSAGS